MGRDTKLPFEKMECCYRKLPRLVRPDNAGFTGTNIGKATVKYPSIASAITSKNKERKKH